MSHPVTQHMIDVCDIVTPIQVEFRHRDGLLPREARHPDLGAGHPRVGLHRFPVPRVHRLVPVPEQASPTHVRLPCEVRVPVRRVHTGERARGRDLYIDPASRLPRSSWWRGHAFMHHCTSPSALCLFNPTPPYSPQPAWNMHCSSSRCSSSSLRPGLHTRA